MRQSSHQNGQTESFVPARAVSRRTERGQRYDKHHRIPDIDEPLPTRAELADLVHHGLMSADDARGYPVIASRMPDMPSPPQPGHHPIWGVLTLLFIGIAIGIMLV